jgi:hypothetical protein
MQTRLERVGEEGALHVGPWKTRARVRPHVPAVCGVAPCTLERTLCLPSNEPKTTPINLSQTTSDSFCSLTYLENTSVLVANGSQHDYLRAIAQQLDARLT